MTRRTFALSVAAGVGAGAALGAETSKDRGKRLIERTIEALGGDAFRNMRTRTETGRAYSFYRDEVTGLSVATFQTKYLPREGQEGLFEMQRQVFGKQQEDAVLFTASEGFEVTYRGAKPLTDDRVKQFRETTLHEIFYVLRERLDEPGMEFEAAGKDVVENQPVEAIDIFDAENRRIRVWVNSDTFLPSKQRFYRWDAIINDRREEITRYSKYRDAGNGVMWPHTTERERDTEKLFQMYSDQVTVNDPLPDSLFELPNGIRMLKK